MVLLFKHNGSSSKVPLEVGGTNFAQHYSGVNKSMAWDELEPSIRQCTEKFVIPFIGEELYDDLSEKFQDNALATSAQRKAVQHLQDCIAFYAIYHILPEKTGVLASMGVVQNNPTDATPISQWSWKSKRADALTNGDFFLEKALAFLETQVIDEVPYFDLYKNSTAYKNKTSAFFRRTADLDDYLNIQNSRRTFVSLIRYVREVEDQFIRPLLCDALFQTMADPDTANSPTAAVKDLLKSLKKAAAFLGLFEAIPHHRVLIESDGFRFVSESDGYDRKEAQRTEEQSYVITDLRQKAEEKGRKALAEALNILRNNESTFPTWTSSPCYSQVPDTGHTIIVSQNAKGGIGIF